MITDNPTPEQPEQASPPPHHAEVPAPVPADSVPDDEATDDAAPESLEAEAPQPEASIPDEEATEEEMPEGEAAAEAEPAAAPVNEKLQWYVVKVQSGREETIKEAIERRVKIEGLQDIFGQIVIPTEKVSEMRKNKRYIRERKLLPGYLMVQVEFNEHMLYLFRETSGVGDFVGAGIGKKPLPMSDREVQKWVEPKGGASEPVAGKGPAPFNEGDRVKVKDGMFSGMEGVVKQIQEAKGAVVVELTIFGRPVPVELEYWQVDFA
jgi:transcription termination/antitermination protein NusG